jgi:hypothetical protein
MTEAATLDNETTAQPTELQLLKGRADMLGIKYSNNISLETLRERVNAKVNGDPDPAETVSEEPNALDPNAPPKAETRQEMRDRLHLEAMKLVRVRITNMDPKKKDLPGEIIAVGNDILGVVKKYIPYGEASENGYHIPQIIYDELKDRKFLDIRTSKKAGQISVSQKWAREFSLEVLPPLTEQELARLAAAQAAGRDVE